MIAWLLELAVVAVVCFAVGFAVAVGAFRGGHALGRWWSRLRRGWRA